MLPKFPSTKFASFSGGTQKNTLKNIHPLVPVSNYSRSIASDYTTVYENWLKQYFSIINFGLNISRAIRG